VSLQGGVRLDPEWDRGRVFDQDVATVFQSMVKDARNLRVTSVSVKEDRKPRPSGLNTVELLKVASSYLNLGPHQAMQVGFRV
jgi:DNA topoisomerase-3